MIRSGLALAKFKLSLFTLFWFVTTKLPDAKVRGQRPNQHERLLRPWANAISRIYIYIYIHTYTHTCLISKVWVGAAGFQLAARKVVHLHLTFLSGKHRYPVIPQVKWNQK